MAKDIVVKITGDSKDLERALGRAGKASQTFGDRVKRGARVAGLALTGALAVAAKVGFDELVEGQKVMAQTQAVLKSTGGAAKVTADEITGLATELSSLSGIDDEVIQSGENLLLTFKNIRNETGKGNDIFNQATTAALDLSVALGKDMNSSALMLGKALNDPIRGMTALGRAGVQFSESQKAAITRLVETGDVLAAQKIILKEVQSQVGGSAAAYGETLPGQLGKARVAFEEMTASIMLALLPAMTAAAQGAQKVSQFLQKHPALAKLAAAGLLVLAAAFIAVSVASTIATVAASPWIAAVLAVAVAVGVLIVALQSNNRWIRLVASAALAAISPMLLLATTIKRHWGSIAAVARSAFGAVRDAIQSVIGVISTLIGWVSAAVSAFGRLASAIRSLPTPNLPGTGALGGILGHIPGFAKGGTVPGPLGKPVLAVVHGGEKITPPGRGAETINVILDGQRIARAVRFHDGRWAMQNG